MSNPYFFLKKENLRNGMVSLTDADFNHLVKVLRAKPGDIVEISDNEGTRYITSVAGIRKSEALLEIKDSFSVKKNMPEIFLYQCMLKRESMELAIQKTVEIGIDAVIPVYSSRIVSDPQKAKVTGRIERWQQIANQAARQCKRNFTAVILPPERIESISIRDSDLFFMPVESTGSGSLIQSADIADIAEIFCKIPLKNPNRIAYIIGPEGGFEEQEKKLLVCRGALPVSFGTSILRSETASIYFLSVIDYVLKCNGVRK